MKQKTQAKKEEKKKIIRRESYFIKSVRLAKSNLNKTGLMVLFDVLFVVSFFGLKTLADSYDKVLGVPKTWADVSVKLIFSLVYYSIILFSYSFFKYSIMDFIRSLFEKSEFSFKRLGQFYGLNVSIAGIFFAAILLFDYVLRYIQPQYGPWVFIAVAVPSFLFLYVIVNSSHTFFYNGNSMKDSLKNGMKITFMKIKAYRETILVMIMGALLLWLLFFGAGYLVRLAASKNYSMYLSLYAYYKNATLIVFSIAFYLVILINRITFYSLVREKVI